MNILYISKLCSRSKFDELFESCQVKPQQQAQKFHYMLANGLSEIDEVQITAMSGLPISSVSNKKIWWHGSSEIENKIRYRYLPHLNMAIIGHLISFFTAFLVTTKWCLQNIGTDKYVVCDVLNLTISIAAKTAAKLFNAKSVAIVTDIPGFMQAYAKKEKIGLKSILIEFYTILCSHFLKKYNAYIVLTEKMNGLVNPKGNPHIVIEGMVNLKMRAILNPLEDKYHEKVILYAGALHEKYGVKKLLEAFVKMQMIDVQLWIYGSGEMESEIKEFEKEDSRIKNLGVVHNSIVIQEELKATLLVNPRPSDEEFTKYSFPSKNMEYMASGTPLLTTKLPGMPEEYYEHVYLFDDESVEGMARTMEWILNLPKEELHAKGAAAKEFVLREKNNIVQAKRIIDMIKTMKDR